MAHNYKKIGIEIPEILMPAKQVDLAKWSVVACDQYTSQPEYWQQVKETLGDAPSTLHMIFPEVYLEEKDADVRIEYINRNMAAYLEENILVPQNPGFVYVERQTSGHQSRKGLIMAVDLEQYDYGKGSQTLIRATEGTVLDRLPPRIKIREHASIELPHIMLLIDDPGRTVIEPAAERTETFEKLYDFDLMMNGGNIKGYKVDDENTISEIIAALEKLAEPKAFQTKYQVDSSQEVLLFAVGDGNHSLATAKVCWEQLKQTLSEEERAHHPARFALVEVVNVHDDALIFEPIHRVVFNVPGSQMPEEMLAYFKRFQMDAYYKTYATQREMENDLKVLQARQRGHIIPFITSEHYGMIIVNRPNHQLEVGTLQAFLDDYTDKNANIKIDYIHGEEVVEQLGSIEGNIGFYLPPMDKHDLFKTVILDGALPRKTFSLGEAHEKRFYLECKLIVNKAN